jgi:alkylation response protein AidB-like acyl-CoA dehydrogenase
MRPIVLPSLSLYSGALDPRCRLLIVMGKTNPRAPTHRQQSMILVPMPTPGLSVVRPCTVFGADDAPHGHAELRFCDVRVGDENLLLGEGRGFEIAQGRLGGGRIHHCMRSASSTHSLRSHMRSCRPPLTPSSFVTDRLLGMSERALEALLRRVHTRWAFAGPIARKGTVLKDIADCRVEIEQGRLLVLRAAHMMDEGQTPPTPH